MGGVISRFQTLEGKVRHAEGGYTGISPAIRIEERELDRLYEYDASLLESAAAMGDAASALGSASDDGDALKQQLDGLRGMLDAFEDTFRRRTLVITGTEVGR